MEKWRASLLFFCFPLFCYFKLSQGNSTWDQLRVTFGKFTSYPLTAKQAEKAGWKKDATCSGRSNFFCGNRYVNADGDDATRLIFDCDGSLAGMQATIHRTDSYPTIDNEPPWIKTDYGRVALTAYFRDPREICACKGECKKRVLKKPPIGDRLWFQMSDFRKKKNVMVIPLNTNQMAGTPWVEGPCVTAMGRHYRNILIDRDCDKALPIFLLFSEQTKSLIGFGWAGPINVPSTEWEKPPPSVFSVPFPHMESYENFNNHLPVLNRSKPYKASIQRFLKPESNSGCLKNYSTVSVQHVYFVDPIKLTCP